MKYIDQYNVSDKNGTYNVIIEILANSKTDKYEMDINTGIISIDRTIPSELLYPCFYGFIPHTLAGDGDCADVMIIDEALNIKRGDVIITRIIGVLKVEDQDGEDWKFIGVNNNSIIKELEDVNIEMKQKIEYFYSNYKNSEQGKWSEVDGWESRIKAENKMAKCVIQQKGENHEIG